MSSASDVMLAHRYGASGQVGSYDLLGDKVANEMFGQLRREDLLDDEFGAFWHSKEKRAQKKLERARRKEEKGKEAAVERLRSKAVKLIGEEAVEKFEEEEEEFGQLRRTDLFGSGSVPFSAPGSGGWTEITDLDEFIANHGGTPLTDGTPGVVQRFVRSVLRDGGFRVFIAGSPNRNVYGGMSVGRGIPVLVTNGSPGSVLHGAGKNVLSSISDTGVRVEAFPYGKGYVFFFSHPSDPYYPDYFFNARRTAFGAEDASLDTRRARRLHRQRSQYTATHSLPPNGLDDPRTRAEGLFPSEERYIRRESRKMQRELGKLERGMPRLERRVARAFPDLSEDDVADVVDGAVDEVSLRRLEEVSLFTPSR